METKGLIMVHTGDGKGKTTAALGLALRAWGSGLRVMILQFIKGSWKYGELDAIAKLGEIDGRIEIRPLGLGLMSKSEAERQQHIEAAHKAMAEAEKVVVSSEYDLVILDEINYAVKFGLIEIADVLSLLEKKPPQEHILLTGRDAKDELIEKADLVTEMKLIKHPFQKGIKAQRGIEF